jgi:hypothetical protein
MMPDDLVTWIAVELMLRPPGVGLPLLSATPLPPDAMTRQRRRAAARRAARG